VVDRSDECGDQSRLGAVAFQPVGLRLPGTAPTVGPNLDKRGNQRSNGADGGDPGRSIAKTEPEKSSSAPRWALG
jgi:hypothetical protein